jgi:hypothetical protein
LPPIQQGREFHSLDTIIDSETKKQTVEVSFYGAPRHFELAGNLGVVAALQKQLNNLLFPRAQTYFLFPDQITFPFHRHYSERLWVWLQLSKCCSTHNATL